MNETLNCLKKRRSIRKYKPMQVEESLLEQVLEAGVCAPTAKNLQSPIIVVIQDADTIRTLSRMNAEIWGRDIDPFYGAPTVLVVLADAANPNAVPDGCLVMGNLMNAAYSLGLGSCWINRAKEVFDSEQGKALLRDWGIDGDYIGVGNCILGYPDEEPAMKPRKEKYIYRVE